MNDERSEMKDEERQMEPRPHEKLEVYRMAHALGLRVHAMSMKLPKFEMYEEGSQIRRSAKSVSSQIVEGHALRQYKAEYVHYLARAYGSGEETIEHLKNLVETGSAREVSQECNALLEEYAVLCRKLFNYTRSVERQHDPNWKSVEETDEEATKDERLGLNDERLKMGDPCPHHLSFIPHSSTRPGGH